jgi:hypothetical protein
MAFEQDLVPRRALRELGLGKNSKVLFFAGGAGDWANCLAREGAAVIFSDISKEIIDEVKAKFPESFVGIEQMDAMQFHYKGRDATLVSFEPLPMYGNRFILFLLRALSYSNGIIIIQRGYLWPQPDREFSLVSYLYGVKARCERTMFVCRVSGAKRFRKTSLLIYSAKVRRNRKTIELDLSQISMLLDNCKHGEDLRKKARHQLETIRTGRIREILKFIENYERI